jgi:hypothetical protein
VGREISPGSTGQGLLRTTICLMGRTPDGPVARTFVVSLKMTAAELATLDRQRKVRGGTDRSDYLRKLIQQDAVRITRSQGTEKS